MILLIIKLIFIFIFFIAIKICTLHIYDILFYHVLILKNTG